MNPLTTCPKVAFWYSGLTLHAATANTVDGLSYDWQCMTGYEVAHQQLHRLWATWLTVNTMTYSKKTIRCWTRCSPLVLINTVTADSWCLSLLTADVRHCWQPMSVTVDSQCLSLLTADVCHCWQLMSQCTFHLYNHVSYLWCLHVPENKKKSVSLNLKH